MSPPEKNLFAEGFADDYVQKIRATPDRSSLLDRIMQNPMERRRVEIALGRPRAEQLNSFLRLEGVMDKMRTAMGNSTTAQQTADMLKGYGTQGLGFNVRWLTNPAEAIAGAIIAGGREAQLRINERVANEVAQLLTSRDPTMFLQGLQQLGSSPIADAIRMFDHMLNAAQPIAIQAGVNQNSARNSFAAFPDAEGR
jgi:hypothetical protein